MTTAYPAGGSRQTVILTAIIGLHFGLFLLIASGLGPRAFKDGTPDAPVILIPRQQDPIVTDKPDRPDPLEIYLQPVPKPDSPIPSFEEHQDPPTSHEGSKPARIDSGDVIPKSGEYQPPALRTRDRRLAALIDSCYPAAARRRNEEGQAVARITIDDGGKAKAWSVAHSSGFPVLDAAMGCVIEPLDFVAGRREGHAVEAEALLPIVFRLD